MELPFARYDPIRWREEVDEKRREKNQWATSFDFTQKGEHLEKLGN